MRSYDLIEVKPLGGMIRAEKFWIVSVAHMTFIPLRDVKAPRPADAQV